MSCFFLFTKIKTDLKAQFFLFISLLLIWHSKTVSTVPLDGTIE